MTAPFTQGSHPAGRRNVGAAISRPPKPHIDAATEVRTRRGGACPRPLAVSLVGLAFGRTPFLVPPRKGGSNQRPTMGARIGRLRCPADILGDKPPSSPADRCTRLCPASSATGSAGQRGRSASILQQLSIEFVGIFPKKPIRNRCKNDTGQGKAKTTSRSLGANWERRLAAKRSFTVQLQKPPGQKAGRF